MRLPISIRLPFPSTSARTLSTSIRHSSSSSFTFRPAPPALPAAQQREFEELIRRVNAPASRPAEGAEAEAEEDEPLRAASVEEMVMHPDFRKKPKPLFEGSTNPETGEVGGPKTEPLAHGDWAYGGKVTDF